MLRILLQPLSASPPADFSSLHARCSLFLMPLLLSNTHGPVSHPSYSSPPLPLPRCPVTNLSPNPVDIFQALSCLTTWQHLTLSSSPSLKPSCLASLPPLCPGFPPALLAAPFSSRWSMFPPSAPLGSHWVFLEMGLVVSEPSQPLPRSLQPMCPKSAFPALVSLVTPLSVCAEAQDPNGAPRPTCPPSRVSSLLRHRTFIRLVPTAELGGSFSFLVPISRSLLKPTS